MLGCEVKRLVKTAFWMELFYIAGFNDFFYHTFMEDGPYNSCRRNIGAPFLPINGKLLIRLITKSHLSVYFGKPDFAGFA